MISLLKPRSTWSWTRVEWTCERGHLRPAVLEAKTKNARLKHKKRLAFLWDFAARREASIAVANVRAPPLEAEHSIQGGGPPYCCLLERQRLPETSSPRAGTSLWSAKTAKPSKLHPQGGRGAILGPK